MSDKEQQRNLKKEVGRQAAEAIAEVQRVASQLALEHRVLAAQMLDFEKTVATVRASRAADQKHYDADIDHLRARLIACEQDCAASGRREARLADSLRIEHARTTQFESMSLWRRLRWGLTGARPPFYDPVNDALVDPSPATAYPGDGL